MDKEKKVTKNPGGDESKQNDQFTEETEEQRSYLQSLLHGENKKQLYGVIAVAAVILAILVAINIFVQPRTSKAPPTKRFLTKVEPEISTYKQERPPAAQPLPAEKTESQPSLEKPGEAAPAPAQTTQIQPNIEKPLTAEQGHAPVEPERAPLESKPAPVEPKPAPAEPKAGAEMKPAPVQPAPVPSHAAHAEKEGVAFTGAIIKVLDDELNQTTLGWRPNSFFFGKLGLTDNVNNRQLGVLETVRIVTWVLKEKISRYGDADAFNPYLENAVNMFMNSAFQFWFPAADDQFNLGLKDLKKYKAGIEAGTAHFYPRSDNFEALIEACKELVGNCHHNLVKKKESDGSYVSMWMTDDYFYYAQGVALAMSQILEAALVDFKEELQLVKGTKLMNEVVDNLKEASQLDPLIVLNGPLDGLRANHRADMAVPMGEALFKLSNLLKY